MSGLRLFVCIWLFGACSSTADCADYLHLQLIALSSFNYTPLIVFCVLAQRLSCARKTAKNSSERREKRRICSNEKLLVRHYRNGHLGIIRKHSQTGFSSRPARRIKDELWDWGKTRRLKYLMKLNEIERINDKKDSAGVYFWKRPPARGINVFFLMVIRTRFLFSDWVTNKKKTTKKVDISVFYRKSFTFRLVFWLNMIPRGWGNMPA